MHPDTETTPRPASASTRLPRATLIGVVLTAACLLGGTAAQAQSYVNITAGGQFAPGVFGQISIGNAPPPPVVNVQPLIIGTPVPNAAVIYMHVPEYEARHWKSYCHQYRVCGQPVHFVRVEDNNRWWERRDEGQHMRHDEGRDMRREQDYNPRRDGMQEHDNGRRRDKRWEDGGDGRQESGR